MSAPDGLPHDARNASRLTAGEKFTYTRPYLPTRIRTSIRVQFVWRRR